MALITVTPEVSTTSPKINKTNPYWLLLGLILLGYVILQVVVINTLPLAYEEGVNLQVSHFMGQGYQPYTEIFTLSGPLFIWLMGWSGKLGLAIVGLKLLFLLFGVLLVLVTATITRFWFNDWAALAAAFLLASATTFMVEAVAVINVIPAVAIALVALLLTLQRRNLWLFLAGTVWGCAMFISVSVVSVGLTALLVITFAQADTPTAKTHRRSVILALAAWLTGAILALGVGQLLAGAELKQIFSSYAIIRSNLAVNQAGNFAIIGQFLTYNLWLSLLAIYAVTRFYQQDQHRLWLVLIWLLLGFAWLMVQVPLRPADVAILLPPLAILAGWGLADAGQRWTTYSQTLKRAWWTGLVMVLASFYLLVSWQRFNDYTLQNVDNSDDLLQMQQVEALAQFIRQHTQATDCVIIDDPALAIVANRWPTPQLAGLSTMQLTVGLMDTKQLATLIAEGNCTAIVLSKREYHQHLLQFGGWLQENYPHTEQLIRTRIYFK